MKTTTVRNLRRAGVLALATLLVTGFATAQDAPPSAPPAAAPAAPAIAPVQDAPGATLGGRANRGGNNAVNVQRGNQIGGFGGLNLDDKQRELLQEARQVSSEELRKLMDKLAEAQKELVKVVAAEKYDEKVVLEKAEIVSKIQTEITMLGAKAFASISPTLTLEQRDQLENNYIVGIALINGTGRGGGGPGGNFAAGNQIGNAGGRGGNFPGGDPAAAGFGGGRGQGGNFGGRGPGGGDPAAAGFGGAGGGGRRGGGGIGGAGGAAGGNAGDPGNGNTRRRGGGGAGGVGGAGGGNNQQ